MDNSFTLIEKAVIEAQSGNKNSAKKLLAQVIINEPGNAQAWYLLSQLLEEKEQIIYCVNKVVEITPDNSEVKAQLKILQPESTPEPSPGPPIEPSAETPAEPFAEPPAETPAEPFAEPSAEPFAELATEPFTEPTTLTPPQKKGGLNKRIIIASAGICSLCIILLCLYFGINALRGYAPPSQSEASQPPSGTESFLLPVIIYTNTTDITPTNTIIQPVNPGPTITPIISPTLLPTSSPTVTGDTSLKLILSPTPTIGDGQTNEILDVKTIIGHQADEVESILGTPSVVTANNDQDDILAGGEYWDYYIDKYWIMLSFDSNGIAKGVQVLDGLSAEDYSINDWDKLLQRFGLVVTIPPDEQTPAALTWINYQGYGIAIIALSNSGQPVWTVQIEDASVFGK